MSRAHRCELSPVLVTVLLLGGDATTKATYRKEHFIVGLPVGSMVAGRQAAGEAAESLFLIAGRDQDWAWNLKAHSQRHASSSKATAPKPSVRILPTENPAFKHTTPWRLFALKSLQLFDQVRIENENLRITL